MHGAAPESGNGAKSKLAAKVYLHVFHENARDEADCKRDNIRKYDDAEVP